MVENLEKIRPALTALEVGDAVVFPISRLKSVRTQASELVLSSIAGSKRKPTARTRQLPFHGSLKIQSYVVWHHFSLWITLYPMTHSLTTFLRIVRLLKSDNNDLSYKPAQGL